MNCEDDYQAVGMLQALYKLGSSVWFIPTLVRYYKVLVMTERGEMAMQVLDELCATLKEDLHVSPQDCKQLAKNFFKEKDYQLSILFDIIGNILWIDVIDDEWILLGITKNFTRLLSSINNVMEKYSCTETLKRFIVPKIRSSLFEVCARVKGKSKKALAIMEVAYKHKLEQMERSVGDIDAAEKTLRESLNLLQSVLGEEAKELHLLGTVLNNLGSTCLQKGNIRDAKYYLLQAIEVNSNAQDYSSEGERVQDVSRSQNALRQVEEILGSRNSN